MLAWAGGTAFFRKPAGVVLFWGARLSMHVCYFHGAVAGGRGHWHLLPCSTATQQVLWVMQPSALTVAPAGVPPMAASRSSLLPRLLRRVLGRLSCTVRPAVVN